MVFSTELLTRYRAFLEVVYEAADDVAEQAYDRTIRAYKARRLIWWFSSAWRDLAMIDASAAAGAARSNHLQTKIAEFWARPENAKKETWAERLTLESRSLHPDG